MTYEYCTYHWNFDQNKSYSLLHFLFPLDAPHLTSTHADWQRCESQTCFLVCIFALCFYLKLGKGKQG